MYLNHPLEASQLLPSLSMARSVAESRQIAATWMLSGYAADSRRTSARDKF